MLEIEMKFAVADFAPVLAHLRAWNARPEEPIDERDQYYNAPDRDFARTDEVFRLRRIGADCFLTYKGPKGPGPVKTRPEIEVAVGSGDTAARDVGRLLTHLGYREVAEVHKVRHIYHFQRDGFALQICLDELQELGRFVEVEIVAPPEKAEQAQQVILRTAAELGLQTPERRSYLGMLSQKRGESSRPS